MKLKIYIYLFFVLVVNSIYAQVGIGTTSPASSSALDITSTNSGLLIPRIALLSTSDIATITSPTTSLLVYNSGFAPNGFYYWNGSLWVQLAVGTNWSLTGNSGTSTATNFLGTTDDVDIVLRRFNVRAGFIGNPVGVTSTTLNVKNTTFGANSLLNTATGYRNTAIGSNVMTANSSGSRNVAVGDTALASNTIGIENTAVGVGALFSNSSNNSNTAIGRNALTSSTADFNTAIGDRAMTANTTGTLNTALGVNSLFQNTQGSYNAVLGVQALRTNSLGSNNVALGYQAGYKSLGNNNVFIGNIAGYNETGNNKLYIENADTATNPTTSADNSLIYGDFTTDIVRINGTLQISNPGSAPGYALPNVRGSAGNVLQTDGAGGTTWTSLSTLGWSLTGNSGTTAGTNFIGTTDDKALRFKTNNFDRFEITTGANLTNGGQLLAYNKGTNNNPTYTFQSDPNTGMFSSSGNAIDFTTSGTNRLRIKGDQVQAMGLGTALMPFYTFQADQDTGFFSSGANSFDIATGGIARVQVDANGNVGVGVTPSAGNKLEVNGKTKTTNFQMTTGAAANTILQSDATGNASWVAPTSIAITETDPEVSSVTSNVVPKWNGTTLIDGVMTDNGTNVGVGVTPSAGNKLEVNGKTKTANFQMTTGAAANTILQSDAAGNASWVAPTSIAITETDPQVSSATSNVIPKWDGTTLVDGVITDDGTNVGIGVTPSVGNKLEVSGKTKTTDFQMTTGAAANYVLQSDASGNASWALPNNTLSVTRTNLSVNQSLGTGGWQKIMFNTVVFDLNTEFVTGTNRFVAAKTGYYEVNAGYHTDNQANTQFYSIGVYKNNTLYQINTGNHTNIGIVSRNVKCIVSLTAGDYIEIFAENYQSGVNLDSYSGKTYFEVTQIR